MPVCLRRAVGRLDVEDVDTGSVVSSFVYANNISDTKVCPNGIAVRARVIAPFTFVFDPRFGLYSCAFCRRLWRPVEQTVRVANQ